jgi:8-oxo-dGTP pyrophosphatase MutT (NUDIX family)
VDALFRLGLRIAYRMLRLYWFVVRPRRSGAQVALWSGGRVLVIQNSYRRPASLPAGNLHRGETPAEAAARELREEVGVAVDPGRLRFVRTVVHDSDYKEDHTHLFELEMGELPRLELDGREVVEAEWMTLEQALARELTTPARAYLEALAHGEGPGAFAPQIPSRS